MGSNTTSINKNAKIVITGVSGFVATAIVDELIKRGYTNIHGSVRSLTSDPSKIAHLHSVFPPQSLHLFEADLTKPGSFDAAIDGAEYIFHTATPLLFSTTDNQRDIVDPAVNVRVFLDSEHCTNIQS